MRRSIKRGSFADIFVAELVANSTQSLHKLEPEAEINIDNVKKQKQNTENTQTKRALRSLSRL